MTSFWKTAAIAALATLTLGASAMAQTATLPAPLPEGVAVTVDLEQSGQAITASVGDKIAVTLVGNPSTRSMWSVVEKPAFLADPHRTSGPLNPSPNGRPLLGGNRWDVLVFEVTAAGEGALKLERRAGGGDVIATFELAVTAN